MLAAALPVARSLGIDPALVTCDESNTGSRRVIEGNGGVLEDKRGSELRFWVPTGQPRRGGAARIPGPAAHRPGGSPGPAA
jgi:hypothetical protein